MQRNRKLVALTLLFSSIAFAEPPLRPGPPGAPVSATAFFLPGSDGAIGAEQFQLTTGFPVWRDERQQFIVTARGSYQRVSSLALADGTLPLPNAWKQFELGFVYGYRFEDMSGWTVRTSLGSASDKLFAGRNGITSTSLVSYAFPVDKSSQWALLLFYSNVASVAGGVPLPGFTYSYAPGPRFFLLVGLPVMSLLWRASDRWQLSLVTQGPTSGRAEVAWGDPDATQVFAAFLTGPQMYLRRDRVDVDDRLFFDERRASVGLRRSLGGPLFAELQGGWAFHRSVFEARGYFDRARSRTTLGAGAFANLSVAVSFGPPASTPAARLPASRPPPETPPEDSKSRRD